MSDEQVVALLNSHGFDCKWSADGKRRRYRTPAPQRRWMDRRDQVDGFLSGEHAAGRLLHVRTEMFEFGKRKKSVGSSGDASKKVEVEVKPVPKTTVQLLTPDPAVSINHKEMLSNAATQLDGWLNDHQDGGRERGTGLDVDALKAKIAGATDERSLLSGLMSDTGVVDMLCQEVADLHLSEIACLKLGPLEQFPPDVNENVYAKIVSWSMVHAPLTFGLVARLATRSGKAVLPSDVVVVANAMANMCHLANKNLAAVTQLRSWSAQEAGLTDAGLNKLAACKLTNTARSLNKRKDHLAELGPQFLAAAGKKQQKQYVFDNVDFGGEHLMLKVSEVESLDTRNLSRDPMSKQDALGLFKKELVLMNGPEREKEHDYLLQLLAHHWGAEVGALMGGRAEKLATLLSGHPPDSQINSKPKASTTFIERLYPCQETSHTDMIKMLKKVKFAHLAGFGVGIQFQFTCFKGCCLGPVGAPSTTGGVQRWRSTAGRGCPSP